MMLNKYLGEQDWERQFFMLVLQKTGFQIEGSDLIQFKMEDRLRHTSGPGQTLPIRYIYSRLLRRRQLGGLVPVIRLGFTKV